MRISKRDLKFLLALVGLLAFLALYFLVAQRYQSKTDSVRASVSVLEPQVAELEGYHQNLTTYE